MIKKINQDFAWLVFFLLVFNCCYFQNASFPVADTQWAFKIFYYFYGQYYFHHEIAQWLPYTAYGIPSFSAQFVALTPMQYLAIFFGSVFHIKNVLFLFKLSVLAEELVFLTGMYLLAKKIYSKRLTVFIIGLGAIGCITWYSQLYWAFRIYYLFPFVLNCLLEFFNTKQLRSLCFMGMWGMVWLLGNNQYCSPFWFLVLSCFFIVLSLNQKEWWKSVIITRKDIFYGILLIAMLLLYLLCLFHVAHSITMAAPDRDEKGHVPMSGFLTYGGNPSLSSLVKGFICATPVLSSFTNLPVGITEYIGLLPLVFFVWSIFSVRNPVFYALLFNIILLQALAFGGVLASIIYYFPGMSMFRHIALTGVFNMMLILIASGFGIDDFLKRSGGKKYYHLFWIVLFFVFLLDMSAASQQGAINNWSYFLITLNGISFPEILTSFFFRFWVYILVFIICCLLVFLKTRGIILPTGARVDHFCKALLLAAFIIDISSYQAMVYSNVPKLSASDAEHLKTVGNVSELTYQEQRVPDPFTQRQKDAIDLIELSTDHPYYDDYNFIQLDQCYSLLNRSDILTPGVYKFLRVVDPHYLQLSGGCYSPKVRLTSHVIYADSFEDAAQKGMNSGFLLPQGAILRTFQGPEPDLDNSVALGSDGVVDIGEFKANEVDMQADVFDPNGSWLIYTDAFYPGWHARVDGRSAPVAEADLAFKGIYLPQGEHSVRFYFFDGITTTGSILFSILGLIAGILLIFLIGRSFWGCGELT